jgi:hypothetical protein
MFTINNFFTCNCAAPSSASRMTFADYIAQRPRTRTAAGRMAHSLALLGADLPPFESWEAFRTFLPPEAPEEIVAAAATLWRAYVAYVALSGSGCAQPPPAQPVYGHRRRLRGVR